MTSPLPMAIAMDWGGTWTRASVIDRNGEVQWSSRVANPQNAGKDGLLENADGLLNEAIAACGDRPIAGIGVAVAGPVDADTGTLYDPPNLPELDGVSLKERWEPMTGHPVWVGNDANLAALGEYHFGAGLAARLEGDGPSTLVYMTISTGIGGGVVDRGRMYLGAMGVAAEIGHMSMDMSATAPKCQCGSSGCLEALASGTAIARIARSASSGIGYQDSLLATGERESITSESVFQAAAQGDRLALSILDDVVQALGTGLTNVLHLYNPDLVVLGGGVTVGLGQLKSLPRIEAIMRDRAMSQRHKEFVLVASSLGDGVGMAGAAAIVWEAVG